MRVFLTIMILSVLLACNGVKQDASVESGGQSGNTESSLSYSLSTIEVTDSVIDLGDVVFLTFRPVDGTGAPYFSTVPLQVSFYSTGGTARGTFSGSWMNVDGTYSALFTGTTMGTATKIRALVDFRDVVTTYPTVTVQAPVLAWDPSGHEFNYVTAGGSSSPIDFVLTNSGNKAATGCGFPVISDTTNFTIVGDTCGTSGLSAGATCTVQLQANPMTMGPKQATLSRTCLNAGTASTFDLRIRATGVDPVNLAWAPLTHGFATTTVGSTSTAQTFTFTNTGTGSTIGCEAPVVSDPQNFRIVSDSCNRTNQLPGGSCSVTVAARPGTAGSKSATLSRTCVHGGEVTTTANGLTYTAVLPVTLTWSPLVNDFGSVPEDQKSASFEFILTNTNTGTASGCSAPVLSNTTDFQITNDECGTSDQAPATSCRVWVQAIPQSSGTLTTTLSRTCVLNGTYATTTNGLSVTATAAEARLEWLRATNILGQVSLGKESSIRTLPLRNTGTVTATGCSAPVLSDTTNFAIVSDGCGVSDLLPYDQCLVRVKATPGGPASGTVTRTCTTGGTVATTIQATGPGNSISSLADGAGLGHTCVVLDDNGVRCWGLNTDGQLGNATTGFPIAAPIASNATTAVSLSSHSSHTCAVLSDGKVACWGKNSSGQLGTGNTTSSNSPVNVKDTTNAELANAVKVATGESHSCALLTTGKVMCWGSNSFGQLGNGANVGKTLAVEVSNLTNVTAITAGSHHTCAVEGGLVYCWGLNTSGQLGDKSTTNRNVPTLLDTSVLNITDAAAVSAGGSVSCLVRSGGGLVCWGENSLGQLGDGTTTDKNYPVAIAAAGSVLMVDSGGNHTCAVLSTNSVSCWGLNHDNQLGTGTFVSSTVPVAVAGTNTATEVTTGQSHTCALLADSSVKCWGENAVGAKLGDGEFDYKYLPVKFLTLANIVDVAQGDSFVCALDQGGSVFCWGKNDVGQLGDGTLVPHRDPAPVLGMTTAVQIEATDNSVCAVLADSSVSCWGSNEFGTFGNGNTTNSSSPVATGLTGVTSLKMGINGGCALMSNSTVKCWGQNLGDVGNNTVATTLSPATVTGITTATAIAKGQNHSCALLADKTVKCWGRNVNGNLGTGNTTQSLVPGTAVSGLTNVTKIAAHGSHTCAILADKTMKCWGNNSSGQLGDGTTVKKLSPVSPGLSDVEEMVLGPSLTCVVKSTGNMFCFGSYIGENKLSPTPVYGLSGLAVPSVYTDPCAVTTGDELYCWGGNDTQRSNADTNTIRNASGF